MLADTILFLNWEPCRPKLCSTAFMWKIACMINFYWFRLFSISLLNYSGNVQRSAYIFCSLTLCRCGVVHILCAAHKIKRKYRNFIHNQCVGRSYQRNNRNDLCLRLRKARKSMKKLRSHIICWRNININP